MFYLKIALDAFNNHFDVQCFFKYISLNQCFQRIFLYKIYYSKSYSDWNHISVDSPITSQQNDKVNKNNKIFYLKSQSVQVVKNKITILMDIKKYPTLY